MDEQIKRLQSLIDQSHRIVFFGGAGVSTESGISDFRSVDGLYHQHYAHPPEKVLSHSFFRQQPEEFYRFYREKMNWPNALPNDAHRALARLEAAGRLTAIVTQNIDGLHQLAGSKRVYELHGSTLRNTCTQCHAFYSKAQLFARPEVVPRCNCGGIIKPDVVLYEEQLDEKTVSGAIAALRQADLVIVGGTSLVVYPAAGLLNYTHAPVVLVNKSATAYDERAALTLAQPIGQVFSQLIIPTQ